MTCSATGGGAISCPSVATPTITVKTSFDTTQQIIDPGFLTTPIGTNDWTNIFYSFSLQLVDPTVKGRTKGFSEFVAVDLGANNEQGAGTLELLWPLQQSDSRAFLTGLPIPVAFKLTSIAHPGEAVTDAKAGLSVVMVTDANGNATSKTFLEQSNAFDRLGDIYFYFIDTRKYSPGTYMLTVYGDAFAAQQVQFTVMARKN